MLEKKKVNGKLFIDKIESTDHPFFMKIKHFFVSLITSYKYSTGLEACDKIINSNGSIKQLEIGDRKNLDKTIDVGTKILSGETSSSKKGFKQVVDHNLIDRLKKLEIENGATEKFCISVPNKDIEKQDNTLNTDNQKRLNSIYSNINTAKLITIFSVYRN